ncbi:hypothetical protein F4604DRAFT_1938318 [Suillus subluteus]|nr:hypothetical protein F4604DRAFT_1938318 [Suillus subluteus]
MDDDTFLIMLGDHGMDKMGNHGGDSILECQLFGSIASRVGSPYLMFWLIFSDVWLTTPLSGQIVLGLSAVALLSYLEILDSVRGVRSLNNAVTSSILDLANTNPNHALLFSFPEIVPLALLATHMCYSTGHQSTFSSIQMEKRIHPLKDAFLPLFPHFRCSQYLWVLFPRGAGGTANRTLEPLSFDHPKNHLAPVQTH